MRKKDFLKPINFENCWVYVDDRGIDLVVPGPSDRQIHRLLWKRLDRLRKQAEAARAAGKYKP